MTLKRFDVDELQTRLEAATRICERHGSFESKGVRLNLAKPREIWTTCPGCKADDEQRHRDENLRISAAATTAAYERMLGETFLPKRFIDCTFDSYVSETDEQRRVAGAVRSYAEDFQRHLKLGTPMILLGFPGTGKTHLASALLKALLPRHVGVYTTVMSMIRAVRSTWSKASEKSESDVIAELGGLPLLVIDEIGVQYGSEGESTMLTEVMDLRYRNMLPTVMISNEDLEGFRRYVGDRVYDRATQGGILLRLTGASYRRIAGQEAKERYVAP